MNYDSQMDKSRVLNRSCRQLKSSYQFYFLSVPPITTSTTPLFTATVTAKRCLDRRHHTLASIPATNLPSVSTPTTVALPPPRLLHLRSGHSSPTALQVASNQSQVCLIPPPQGNNFKHHPSIHQLDRAVSALQKSFQCAIRNGIHQSN